MLSLLPLLRCSCFISIVSFWVINNFMRSASFTPLSHAQVPIVSVLASRAMSVCPLNVLHLSAAHAHGGASQGIYFKRHSGLISQVSSAAAAAAPPRAVSKLIDSSLSPNSKLQMTTHSRLTSVLFFTPFFLCPSIIYCVCRRRGGITFPLL